MKFDEFFRAMAAGNVDYVLVGGLAVSLHGVIRGTLDVDIVLATDDENVARFVAVARSLGLAPSLPVPLEALANPSQLETWHREKNMLAFSVREPSTAGLVVDILIRPSVPFTELRSQADNRPLGAISIAVASVDHLIALKSGTGRPIDESDVELLKRLHRR